jgi:hypothetical protein
LPYLFKISTKEEKNMPNKFGRIYTIPQRSTLQQTIQTPSTLPATVQQIPQRPVTLPATVDQIPQRPVTLPATVDQIPQRPVTLPATVEQIPQRPVTLPATVDQIPQRPVTLPATVDQIPTAPVTLPATVFPDKMPVGMCYVPIQEWEEPYEENLGFEAGTIFPSLVLPFDAEKGCAVL